MDLERHKHNQKKREVFVLGMASVSRLMCELQKVVLVGVGKIMPHLIKLKTD